MISVKKIDKESEFSELVTAWNKLLKQSDADNPFLTYPWLHSWWKFYGQESDLMILAVHENQEIVALAPLMVRSRPLGLLRAREIVFLGSFGVGSDYLDLIIRKGFEKAAIDVIFGHLARSKRKWDVISLTNVPDNSASIDQVNKACNKLGYFNSVTASVVCPSIQLPSTWDDYVSSLSKSMQSNIRRKHNKLAKSAEIEYEVIREQADLDAALNDLIHLNRLRMRTKNLQGAFRDNRFTQFHENLMPILHNNNILHLSFLKANSTRIAALYNFIYNDTCYYYQSGLDPDWAKFSPGTVLFSFSIREAIHNGIRVYDFLQGDESYKFNWTNMNRQCVSILIYNKTLAGLLLCCLFLIKSYLKRNLRRAA